MFILYHLASNILYDKDRYALGHGYLVIDKSLPLRVGLPVRSNQDRGGAMRVLPGSTLIQKWSTLSPKKPNQDGDGHDAKLKTSKL